jgi:hypothetical protein
MCRVGFEPMIPVFERVNTVVLALDRSATVIGILTVSICKITEQCREIQ